LIIILVFFLRNCERMRKSLLTLKTPNAPGTSGNGTSAGRITDFIALTDHADLADTSKFSFAEMANRDGHRVFELNNPEKSNVRHIGTEDAEENEFDYCVAFFNRRTKETEYKPISFLRVVPMKRKALEDSGLLEGKQARVVVDYGQNNTISREDSYDKRDALTMEHGNSKKRKILEAKSRRKIGDESLTIMNESMVKDDSLNGSAADSTLDAKGVKKDLANEISLLKTADSMVLPKMNMAAKTPDEIFNLKDFFTDDDLNEFKNVAKTFFVTYSKLDAICGLGVAKFIARRILESCRRSELHAAAALKLLILAMIMPRGLIRSTNVNLQKQTIFSPSINQFMDNEFIKGKVNKNGKCVIEKTYKDKILAHIFGLYFALSTAGDYFIPVGVVSTELEITDAAVKRMLTNVGCLVQSATAEQKRNLNTTTVARLVGGPARGGRGGMSRRGR